MLKRLFTSVVDQATLWMLRRNQMESEPLRDLFRKKYDIDVGLYSYGCFDPWRIARGTTVGRYCSFAGSVRLVNANHPVEALSTHPFLYDPALGVAPTNPLTYVRCKISDDVWVANNVTITAGCAEIGRGAIIGAGAVVTRDVEPYTIVTGSPGRVLRMRFEPSLIEALENSRWWEMDKAELSRVLRANPKAIYNLTTLPAAEIAAILGARQGAAVQE